MLSLAIITKNEENNLKRLFAHFEKYRVLWQDVISEILILDSFSTDDTQQVAKANPLVQFVQEVFLGFGEQKQLMTKLCKNDWVFNLDADELPNAEFFVSLKKFFNEGRAQQFDAMYIYRDTYFLNKRLKYAAGNERRLRIYNRKKYNWNSKKTHENIEPLSSSSAGHVGHIDGRIAHYSWRDIESAIQLQNIYSSRYALNTLHPSKKIFTVINVFFRFEAEFAKRFLFRCGFLDGIPGFIFSYLMAFSHAVKYMKVYERSL